MKSAPVITLSTRNERLGDVVAGAKYHARRVLRAKIVLMAAECKTNETIAAIEYLKPTVDVGVGASRCCAWRDRKGCSSSWSHTAVSARPWT